MQNIAKIPEKYKRSISNLSGTVIDSGSEVLAELGAQSWEAHNALPVGIKNLQQQFRYKKLPETLKSLIESYLKESGFKLRTPEEKLSLAKKRFGVVK